MQGSLHEFSGKRILVIENGSQIAEDLRAHLDPQGVTIVETASSAALAIAIINIGRIDAALLAIEIETDCAFDVIEALQEHGIPHLFVAAADADRTNGRYAPYETGTPSALLTIGQALFGELEH